MKRSTSRPNTNNMYISTANQSSAFGACTNAYVKQFNRSTIRRGEAFRSCLRWTPSFHEKRRPCHISAEWNRRYDADESGRARLGIRDRKTDKPRQHFLVRRFRARE